MLTVDPANFSSGQATKKKTFLAASLNYFYFLELLKVRFCSEPEAKQKAAEKFMVRVQFLIICNVFQFS